MKTLTLFAMLLIAVPPSKIQAQEMRPDWSINLHASPYLFEGQIEQSDWISDYSYHTFFGVDFMRGLSEHFALSASFDYTKARADIRPVLMESEIESSIPMNSFLTESYSSCLKLSFLPTSSGSLQPHLSAGFGLTYFAHESKSNYRSSGTGDYPPWYSSQRVWVPFMPAQAGMLFDICRIGNFRLGFDVSVLAMFSLRDKVLFNGAGKMTQPISTGIITGVSIGW